MEYSKFLILFISLNLIQKISAVNTTEKLDIIVPEKTNETTATNKTIDKLVQEQTDLIKRIISNHKLTPTEFPVIAKKELESKDKLKEIKEKESIEELRKKCQELTRLEKEQNTKTTTTTKIPTTRKLSTVQSFGPQLRPAILQKLQSISERKWATSTRKPTSYFYVTRKPATISPYNFYKTEKENLTSNFSSPLNDLKYIPLEPVMLQKTALNDGSILYYWYRTQVPLPQSQEKDKPLDNSQLPLKTDKPTIQTSEGKTDLLSHYGITFAPPTETPSTTISYQITQKPKVPNYEIEYKSGEEDNGPYKKQMKFVLQMPYPSNPDIPTLYPWQFDPYAYAPKHLQPKIVNIPMPYVPSYQMIRMLQIPNQQ